MLKHLRLKSLNDNSDALLEAPAERSDKSLLIVT